MSAVETHLARIGQGQAHVPRARRRTARTGSTWSCASSRCSSCTVTARSSSQQAATFGEIEVGVEGMSRGDRRRADATTPARSRRCSSSRTSRSPPSVLAQALELDRRASWTSCATAAAELEARGSGLVLRNVAGGWRLFTHPDTAPIVERFVLSSRQARLTKAALETLAIVAYKQPVTRHQVSAIRGVNSDGVLRALVDRGLIEEAGRDEGPAARCCTPRRRSSSSGSACPRWPRCRRSRRCWSRDAEPRGRRRPRGRCRRRTATSREDADARRRTPSEDAAGRRRR